MAKKIVDLDKQKENKAKKQKDIAERRSNILKLLIPVILGAVAIFILILLGLNRYLFRFNIDEEGYAIPKNLSLSSVNTDAREINQLYRIDNGDGVYTLKDNKTEFHIGNEKVGISSGFPVFVRNGQVLYFLDNSSSIISNDFDYIDTYAGLRLSEGITFNSDDSRADLNEIILVDNSFGYQLAQDSSFGSDISGKHDIPMNTICNFQKDKVDCFEYDNGFLQSYSITVGETTPVKLGDNEYTYKELLEKLGLWKDKTTEIEIIVKEEEEKIPERHKKVKTYRTSSASASPSVVFEQPTGPRESGQSTHEPRHKPTPEREEYVEPIVSFNPDGIVPWVYTITVPMEAYDPTREINGGVTIHVKKYEVERDANGNIVYEGGEPKTTGIGDSDYLTSTFLSKNDTNFYNVTLGTLEPNCYYRISYAYSYFGEFDGIHNLPEQVIGNFVTLPYSELEDISLYFDNSDVSLHESSFDIHKLVYSGDDLTPDSHNPNKQLISSGDPRVNSFKDFNSNIAEYFITKIVVNAVENNDGSGGIIDSDEEFNNATIALSQVFDSNETALMKKGFMMDTWSSRTSLKPGTEYAYKIYLYDKFDHLFEYNGVASGIHYTHTCKRAPSVVISIPSKSMTPTKLDMNIKWVNDNQCVIKSDEDLSVGPRLYITQDGNELTRENGIPFKAWYINEDGTLDELIEISAGQGLKIDYIDGESFTNIITKVHIEGLNTQTKYSAYVIASYDDESIEGDYVHDKRLLDDFSFKMGGLTSYGLVRYSGYADEIGDKSATIHPRLSYNRNGTYFNYQLADYISQIKLDIAKQSDANNPISSIIFEKEKLKDIAISDTGAVPVDGVYTLPTSGKYIIPVKYYYQEDGEYEYVDAHIFATIHYKSSMPQYINDSNAEPRTPTNLWEYIIATSNATGDAYIDIALSQGITVSSAHGAAYTQLAFLEEQTAYRASLAFFGAISASSPLEDLTYYASTPITFRTKKVEPYAGWGDLYISDNFIEIYNLRVTDPDSCLSTKEKLTSESNARIEIKDERGNLVSSYPFDTYSDIPSPIRINGLTREKKYSIEVVANEYSNNNQTQTSYPLLLENTSSSPEFMLRIFYFVAKGVISGNIDIDSLYRNYAHGPTGYDSNKYIGLIRNELVELDPNDSDNYFDFDATKDTFDINKGLIDNLSQTGWQYDDSTNTYVSSLTKIPNNANYSLFTSAKSINDNSLPEYVKQIDYIESSGIQYINLGYYHNEYTEVYINYQPLNTKADWNVLFGSRTSTSNPDCFNFGFDFHSSKGYFFNLGPAYPTITSTDTQHQYLNIDDLFNYHTFSVSGDGIISDNKEIYPLFTDEERVERNAKIGTAELEDYLLALNQNNTPYYYSAARLKAFTVSEQGLIIMNLVPVITTREVDGTLVNTKKSVKAGVPCMYDTISGKLFVNSGSGEFGYPSSLVSIPTLENTHNGKLKQVSYIATPDGNEYIDTGYKHNNDTVIDAIYLPLRSEGTWYALFGSRSGLKKLDTWDIGFNNTTNYYFLNTTLSNYDNIMISREYEEYSVMRLTATALTVNGKSTSTGVSAIGDAAYTDYIFAINEGSATNKGMYRLKYFKISENGTPIREFIPVVVTENITAADGISVSVGGQAQNDVPVNAGEAGLYDVIHDVLYLNSGNAGEFSYPGKNGEGVNPDDAIDSELTNFGLRRVQYIRSNNGQYIDTGLRTDYGYDVKVKFSPFRSNQTWAHIIGSHDDTQTSTHSHDGTQAWHHSMLRIYNGTSLRASYQNNDRFNANITPSLVYEAEMAIYDTYSDFTNRKINPRLEEMTEHNDPKRNAGYLKINGAEVWNAADELSINLERSFSASLVNTRLTLFGSYYPEDGVYNRAFGFSNISIYSCEINVPNVTPIVNSSNKITGFNYTPGNLSKRNYIPCIATEDIPAEKVSYKGETGVANAPKGTAGLYDTVTKLFYINSGSGSFRYGDYESGDNEFESVESGTYTINIYSPQQITDRESGETHLGLVELDHVNSDLVANGNIFNVNYQVPSGNDMITPDDVYIQIRVENPSDSFRINDIYLEAFDDRWDIENKINLIENFNDDNIAPLLENYSYDEEGNRVDNKGYAVSTEFTSIKPDSTYYLSGTNLYDDTNTFRYTTRNDDADRTLANLGDETRSSNLIVAFYNQNKEFISSQYVGSQGALFKSPAGAYYARFSLRGSLKDVASGQEPTSPSSEYVFEQNVQDYLKFTDDEKNNSPFGNNTYFDSIISDENDTTYSSSYRYKLVDYIESDATHWIDTGYRPTNNTKWVFDYQFITPLSGQVGTGASDSGYFILYLSNGMANFGIGNTTIASNIPIASYRHTFELNAHTKEATIDNNKTIKFTDATVNFNNTGDFADETITFFARKTRKNWYQCAAAGKLYSSTIYEYEGSDYVLKHHYLPVVRTKLIRNANGEYVEVSGSEVYGIYDIGPESDGFLMSRTEQGFKASRNEDGDVIDKDNKKVYYEPVKFDDNTSHYKEIAYIEANGGQIIDTGFIPTSTTVVNMTFEPAHYNASSTPQALAGAAWSGNAMLMDIQSGVFQHHGLAMNADYILGYDSNLANSKYVMPLDNRIYNIIYGSRDNGFELDINYVDTEVGSASEGKTREFGLDWRFARYAGNSSNVTKTPYQLKDKSPDQLLYLNDRRLGSNFNLANYYDATATTWLYVENDLTKDFNFYTDDMGKVFARYADGSVLGGGASADDPYGAGFSLGACSTKKVTLTLKKGWNEIVVCYHEQAGGDYFNVTPRFNTVKEITRRSADYPLLHEINKNFTVGDIADGQHILEEFVTEASKMTISTDSMGNALIGNLTLLGLDMGALNYSTLDNTHPSKYYSYGKLYGATVDIDSTHRIVFTPVIRESDGAVGLWGEYQVRTLSTDEKNLPSWQGVWTSDSSKTDRFFPRASTQTTLTGGKVLANTESYQELNYIEAVGAQYIYTGIYPDDSTEVTLEFAPTLSTGSASVVGTAIWNANDFLLDYQSSQFYLHGKGDSIIAQSANVKHKFVYSTSYYSIDDRPNLPNFDTLERSNGNAIYLLGHGANSYNARGKLFYLQIRDTDKLDADGNPILLRDYIPVKRISDGAVGLWDKSTNRFYDNQGGGSFVASKAKGQGVLDLDVPYHVSSNGIKTLRDTKDAYDSKIEFIPEYSGTYRFTSTNIVSGDPYIYIYKANEDEQFPSYIDVLNKDPERKGCLVSSDDDSGGNHNFSIDIDLEAGKKYAIVCTASNIILKDQYEYDLLVTGSLIDFNFNDASLYLYNAANLDTFTATFSANITQDVTNLDENLKDGEVNIRIYQTSEKVTSAVDLETYTNWIDLNAAPAGANPSNVIYHLPKTDALTGGEDLIIMPDPEDPTDSLDTAVPSDYGYKVALNVKRAGRDSEITLDYVTFVATQPVHIIKDIDSLKAVAADMEGYYICTHDIPNEDVDTGVVDFTISDEMFTGVIDWQGHSVTLSSSNPLFNKLGLDSLIKNGNIVYEGEEVENYRPEKYAGDPRFIVTDYIESTGSQYIVTDIQQHDKIEYDIIFERTNQSFSNQILIGSYTQDNNMLLIRLENDGTSAHAALTNNRRYYIRNLDLNKKNQYLLKANEFTVKDLSNGLEHSVPVMRDSYTNGGVVTIFAQDNKGTYKAYGKMYGVKIYDNGSLVFDGIPLITAQTLNTNTNVSGVKDVVVPPGTAGLYNTVDGIFYTSYYPFSYPKFTYSNDLTIARQWVEDTLPETGYSNLVPNIRLRNYWDEDTDVERVPTVAAPTTKEIANESGQPLYLPDNFARMEYLQSDGSINASIDTGYVYTGGTIYCDFEFIDPTVSGYVFGTSSSSSQYDYYATSIQSSINSADGIGYITSYNLGGMDSYVHWDSSIPQKGRHELWLWNGENGNTDKREWRINNYNVTGSDKVVYHTYDSSVYADNKTLYLFADHKSSASANNCKTRIYSMYIMDTSDALQRYFIPCMALEDIPDYMTSTGKLAKAGSLGMYDAVSGLFYVSSNGADTSIFSGSDVSLEFEDLSDEFVSNTACIARDNYGIITNMIMHYGPQTTSAYSVPEYSAGFVLNNYGTINKFALQYTKDTFVKSNVSGIALHNYGTISNGYICGLEYLDGINTEYRGLIHRYNYISKIKASRILPKPVSGVQPPSITKYAYVYSGDNSDAGYISYVSSYNHNKASIENVFVVDNLKIQSLNANAGEYGPWGISSSYLADDILSVEYVESTGSQYIETGYTPNETTEIELVWSPTATTSSQSIVGSSWANDGMNIWLDSGFKYAGQGRVLNVSPVIGEQYKIKYSVYGDSVTINDEEGFNWAIERYAAIANRAVTKDDFIGKTMQYPILYVSDLGATTSINVGDNYSAKATTWVKSNADFDLTVYVKTDDQGCVILNNDQIGQTSSANSVAQMTLPIQTGWNELSVCYREGTGSDGFAISLDSSFASTIDDETRFVDRTCFNPLENKEEKHSKDTNPDGYTFYRSDLLVSPTNTLKIFGLAGNSHNAYGRLYSLKIYERNADGELVLIHDFVPAQTTYDIDASRSATGNAVLKGTAGLLDQVGATGEDGNKLVDNRGNLIKLFYPSFSTSRLVSSGSYDETAKNTDFSALITGYNEGTVKNSFTVGDIIDIEYNVPANSNEYQITEKETMLRTGPSVSACIDSYDNKNVNYVSLSGSSYINDTSTGSYMSNINFRSESASLQDYKWYEKIIGKDKEIFNIRSFVDSNYFPKVIFGDSIPTSLVPSVRLPQADLRIRITGSLTRYVGYTETENSGNQIALVTVLLSNPNDIEFTALKVVDSNNVEVPSKILAQGYYEGHYRVDLLLTYDDSSANAPKAEDTYKIINYATGTEENPHWAEGDDSFTGTSDESTIKVGFYHKIANAADWTRMLSGVNHSDITENYRLTADIDFYDSTRYEDWVVFANFKGKLDGGIYDSHPVQMVGFDGRNLGRTIYVNDNITDMYSIIGVGNVNRLGEYVRTRGMGILNGANLSYLDINSARDTLFVKVSGSISNIIFKEFKTVYFDEENSNADSINDITTTITGVIARAYSGSVLDNLHVRDSQFNTIGYGGALVGYASNTLIRNSSARNVSITGRKVAQNNTPAYLGGLVGYAYNSKFDNSFVANINVNGSVSLNTVGIGGIAGVVDSTDFYACYAANGYVISSGDCTGGIVGKVGEFANTSINDYSHSTTIDSCYSTITVQSTGDFIGGISGYMGIYAGTADRVDANKLFNSYTSSTVISTNYSSYNINRINSHSFEDKRYYFNNYAFENQIMNYKDNTTQGVDAYQYGPSTELNGSTRLLTTESLKDVTTWSGEVMLDRDCYEFEESVSSGFMPKLINSTQGGLLYDQPDELLGNDKYTSMKVNSVENNPDGEELVVEFVLYNKGWEESTYLSYYSKSDEQWYDLADWDSLLCVGAATVTAREDTAYNFYRTGVTPDGGLKFQARFKYGDSEVGHYTDSYLVTLPVYLTEPNVSPRIMSSAYALIALEEEKVAAKVIRNASEWNEFFDYNGVHYNVPENIRLFPADINKSIDQTAGTGDYDFTGLNNVAYNASIAKVYVGYGTDEHGIFYNEDNAEVIFKGLVDYSNVVVSDDVNEMSFISSLSTSMRGVHFVDFTVDYANHPSASVQGIFGDVSGEFSKNSFKNVAIKNADAINVGIIARATNGALIENINLENVSVEAKYKNISNGGFGSFIGNINGTSSKIVTVNNVNATLYNIDAYDGGQNNNVGGLFGNSNYARISNIIVNGAEKEGSDFYKLANDQRTYLDEIEYIESTNGNNAAGIGAFIDTGIIPDVNTKLELDFAPLQTSGTWTTVVGVRNGSGASNSKFSMWIGNNKFYYSYDTRSDAYFSEDNLTGNMIFGNRYNLVMDGQSGIEITDVKNNELIAKLSEPFTPGTTVATQFSNGWTLTLLGVRGNTGASVTSAWQRLYGAKIYNNNVLVRDYVPVKVKVDTTMKVSQTGENGTMQSVKAGTVGLFDKVNNTLYLTGNSKLNVDYYDAGLNAGPYVEDIYNHVKGTAYVGGIFGVVSNTTISGVSASNIDVSAHGNIVGGVIAYGKGSKLINVSKVNNMHVTNPSTNTGGIVGHYDKNNTAYNMDVYDMFSTEGTVENLSGEEVITASYSNEAQLTNITITATSHAGGIVGQAYRQNIKMDKITVDNVTILAQGNDVGGLFGHKYYMPTTFSFNDCSFTNIKVLDGASHNGIVGQYWGGLIGDDEACHGMQINRCTFDNIVVYGDGRVGGLVGRCYDNGSNSSITTADCTFNDIEILSVKREGQDDYGYIGGLVGLARSVNVYLNDGTTVNNIHVVGGTRTGGIIGALYRDTNKLYYFGSSNPISDDLSQYHPVRITNVNIEAYDQFVGGFIGGKTQDSTATANIAVQNVEMDNVKITLKKHHGYVGGIAGNAAMIKNCKIGGLDRVDENIHSTDDRGVDDNPSLVITGTAPYNVGGLVGVLGSTSNDARYTGGGNYIYNAKIVLDGKAENNTPHNVGGIAGAVYCANLTDSTVDHCTVEGLYNVGGIYGLGVDGYYSDIVDCQVVDSLVYGLYNPSWANVNDYGNIGGIGGFSQTSGEISGNTIFNTVVLGGTNVGGIIGMYKPVSSIKRFPSRIHDSGMYDSIVLGVNDYIGGIAGKTSSPSGNIYNCFVTTSTDVNQSINIDENYNLDVDLAINKINETNTNNVYMDAYNKVKNIIMSEGGTGTYDHSCFVLSVPRKEGDRLSNMVGGIAGYFNGASISDCYIGSNTVVMNYQNTTDTYTITGGIAGYITDSDEKGVISDNYDVLDYVESTGTQFVDTGYYPSDKTKIKIKFANLTDGRGANILSGYTSDADNFRLFVSGSKMYLDYGSGGFDGASTPQNKYNRIGGGVVPCNLGEPYEVELGNRYIKDIQSNETIISSTTVSFSRKNYPIYINGNSNPSLSRIYYLQIYDDDILVRDYVPVRRRTDDVVGLYDTITREFVGSDFVASSDIKGIENDVYDVVDYLETTTGAIINTGLYSQDVWKFDINVQAIKNLDVDPDGNTYYQIGAVLGTGIKNYQTTGLQLYLSTDTLKNYFYVGGYNQVSYNILNTNIYHFVGQRQIVEKIDMLGNKYTEGARSLYAGAGKDGSLSTLVNTSRMGYGVTSNIQFWLFGAPANDGNRYGNVRIYSAKLYAQDGRLLRDYVPVRRRSDGELGMFDRISETFVTNSSTVENSKFITNETTYETNLNTLLDNKIMTNCVVEGFISSMGQNTNTGGIIKEATGGFVGYYRSQMAGYIPRMNEDGYYSFPIGNDYNLTQGPDPMRFSNLLFSGGVVGQSNADMGFGVVDVVRPSSSLFNATNPNGGTHASDWTLDPADSNNVHTIIRYNTANVIPAYTNEFAMETVTHSGVNNHLKYNGPAVNMITASVLSDSNTLIKTREAGIGRLRVATTAFVTVNENTLLAKNVYNLTSDYNTNLPVDANNYTQALVVDAPSDVFYYQAANKGNMGLDISFWGKFLSGVFTAQPRLMMMNAPKPVADVDEYMENAKVYASGIDTINIELDTAPYSEFFYNISSRTDSLSGEWPAGQKTITVKYDFSSDVTLTFTSGVNTVTKNVPYYEFANTIMTYNNSYWYLYKGKVVSENGNTTVGDTEYIHMYGGKLLDENGVIYDAMSGSKEGTIKGFAEAEVKPLWSGIINSDGSSYEVNTYSRFTLSDNNEIMGRTYVKNNTLVTLAAPQDIIGGPVVDTYSQNVYAAVLLADGTIADLGTSLNYPNGFKNYDIKEISSTIDYSGRIMLVRYEDDSLVAFNYISGEEVFVKYDEPSLLESFGQFLVDSLRNFSLKKNTSNAEGVIDNASIYQDNLNKDPYYAAALENVNNNLNKSDDNANVSDIVDTPDSTVSTPSSEGLIGDKVDGDIAVPEGQTDQVETGETEGTQEVTNAVSSIKEYTIDNGYVVLYNGEEDKAELFKVSEVLSKPADERVSEEEKAETLEKLGIKTIVPAKEAPATNGISGVALILLTILALFSLIGILFLIRKRNLSIEK